MSREIRIGFAHKKYGRHLPSADISLKMSLSEHIFGTTFTKHILKTYCDTIFI